MLETEKNVDSHPKWACPTIYLIQIGVKEWCVLDRYSTPLSPLSHSILMEWCVCKHQEWYTLNSEWILHFL